MAKRAEMVEARRRKRRKQIFEGAIKVFAEKGFHVATAQEIADAAGLAKGTLYEYVKDKDEILLLVIEEALLMTRTEIEKAIEGIEEPVERLEAAVFVQLSFAKKFRNESKVLKHEIGSLGEECAGKLSRSLNEQIELIKSIMDEGIESGHFKKMNSRIGAELLMHTCSFYSGYGDLPHQKIPLDDITAFIMDHFIQSIIKNDKG